MPSAADSDILLSMDRVSKRFGSVKVLHEVSLACLPGEVHILAGENGAGKSTLVKILAGIHTDYEGCLAMRARPCRWSGPAAAAKGGIAMIHQELSIIPSLTVAENLFLGREPCARTGWIDRHSQQKSARQVLDRLGLDLDPGMETGRLPVATQQLVEIGKALAVQAKVMIMDEPTSALSQPAVEKLFDIIRLLRKDGTSIIYISHRMQEIYALADRITVLRDGRVTGTGTPQEIPAEQLLSLMVGREMNTRFPVRQAPTGPVRFRAKDLRPLKQAGSPVTGLEIRQGEILGLAGLDGSGNHDLLEYLYGAAGPDPHARLELDGSSFTIESPASSLRRGLALLTADRKEKGILLTMNTRENISLPSLRRLSKSGWLSRIREKEETEKAARDFDLRTAGLDQPVTSLSGGNQQKALLARWMGTAPRVMLLDEPTRGIDVGAKHAVYRKLADWTRTGMSFILITSELEELLGLADRILVMHRGCVTAEFHAAEATEEKVIQAAMGTAAP